MFTSWRSFLFRYLDAIEHAAHQHLNDPRTSEKDRKASRETLKLLPLARVAFAKNVDGAELAIRLVQLALLQPDPDRDRGRATLSAAMKGAMVAKTKRRRRFDRRDARIRKDAAALHHGLSRTAKATILSNEHRLSVRQIRRILTPPKK